MSKHTIDNDFGFSAIGEDELHTITSVQTAIQSESEKLIGLQKMINKLLDSFAQNPEKQYLYWPNRMEKLAQFKKQIDDYVKGK